MDGGAGERSASSLALADACRDGVEGDREEEIRLVDRKIVDKVRHYNVYYVKCFAWFCRLMKRYVLLQVEFYTGFM